MTRQLLSFSRKQVLAVTPLSLTMIAGDLEPMLGRLLGERVTIATRLAENLWPVLGDVTQLEHLLINLCVNARDAMPQGGVLTITTRNAELDESYVREHSGASAGSYATMSVADTGVGMTPEVQARIFEPFFTTKERGRGTGLGLAAVYGTVKQLNGYIEVESAVGRGSRFTIHLPRTQEAIPVPDRPGGLGAPVGAETILLVEDEGAVRGYVKILLSRFGYHVLDADSAEAALAILEESTIPVHLVLTDVVLPRMDGRELAVRISEAHPNTRVLFMSGYADDWTEAAHLPIAGGVHLIQKPFSAQALLSKVGQLLGRDS